MFTIYIYNHNKNIWESYKNTTRSDEAKAIIDRLAAAGVDYQVKLLVY